MSAEKGLNGVTDLCDDSGFYLGAAHAVLCCINSAVEAEITSDLLRTAIAAAEKLVWLADRERRKEDAERSSVR